MLRVGWQVGEPLTIHGKVGSGQLRERVVGLLESVGIRDAEVRFRDYPHQFSGGMRQRIVGAAAIACEPALIVADEPTTALDVTVQARYLDLLEKLQNELGAAMLFISHDLAVIGRICQRVAVMYGGRIVETAAVNGLFAAPRHPYTIGLIGCIPSTKGELTRLQPIEGQPPHPGSLPSGCSFAPRCPASTSACEAEKPAPFRVGEDHFAACLRAGEALRLDDLWPPQPMPLTIREIPDEATLDLLATTAPSQDAVLALDNVSKSYTSKKGFRGAAKSKTVHAAQDVTLSIRAGVALSLVGQSGSGKTTCARIALGLEEATSGRVLFGGKDLSSLDRRERRSYRKTLQAVFQDPYSSFNPRVSLAGPSPNR